MARSHFRQQRRQYSCKNPHCNDKISKGFCLSCRWMGKRTAAKWLPVGMLIGGILWALFSKRIGL